MTAGEARLGRLALMTGALLAELGHLQPGDRTRVRLLAAYQRIVAELGPLLPGAGRAELARLGLPDPAEALTPAELRIACAQLPGWLKALHAEISAAAAGPAAGTRAAAGGPSQPG